MQRYRWDAGEKAWIAEKDTVEVKERKLPELIDALQWAKRMLAEQDEKLTGQIAPAEGEGDLEAGEADVESEAA
jgi:hypothetical protein